MTTTISHTTATLLRRGQEALTYAFPSLAARMCRMAGPRRRGSRGPPRTESQGVSLLLPWLCAEVAAPRLVPQSADSPQDSRKGSPLTNAANGETPGQEAYGLLRRRSEAHSPSTSASSCCARSGCRGSSNSAASARAASLLDAAVRPDSSSLLAGRRPARPPSPNWPKRVGLSLSPGHRRLRALERNGYGSRHDRALSRHGCDSPWRTRRRGLRAQRANRYLRRTSWVRVPGTLPSLDGPDCNGFSGEVRQHPDRGLMGRPQG